MHEACFHKTWIHKTCIHKACIHKTCTFCACGLRRFAMCVRRRAVAGNGAGVDTLYVLSCGDMTKEHAQLWIDRDKAQSDTLKKAPEFYE